LPSNTHYFPADNEIIEKVASAIERFVFAG